ncbi:excisionase family protein [Cedecea davisae]|uniref:excisionase family protein n=1 Tax=Cedecea davisae TaxID=158484 RepID=UPI001D0B081F|nr:excisionase family protein [Cedecea davisae]
MPQVIFNEEWMVAAGLTGRTGLSERQIKALRDGVWIEGVHYKRQSVTGGETKRGLLWYNLPQINQLIQEL